VSTRDLDRRTSRWVEELDRDLRGGGDGQRAVDAKAYLKSDLEFIGVAAKPLRETARAFLAAHPEVDRGVLLDLVRVLWQRPVFELKAVAVALLELRTSDLHPDDLELAEELLRRSHTWALVDWICTKVAAPLIERDPRSGSTVLERWSRDDDFWLRRASLLSQLPALRAGRGDFDLFASFASRMVGEKEFFIRKAIGWVLRDVSKKRPHLASGFLTDHIDVISGLSLREGSKHLPVEEREALRERYRTRETGP
jgi:3-methyladenine DNA glycosylase AlkD